MFRFHFPLKILFTLLTLNASEAFIQTQHSGSTTLTRFRFNHPTLSSLETPQTCIFRLRKRQPRPFFRGGGVAAASSSSSRNVDSSSSISPFTRWITGVENPRRPSWARDWMPTGLVRLRPGVQLMVVLLCYIFHMTVLAQRSLSFPIQLIPNERGHFQSIGWDS